MTDREKEFKERINFGIAYCEDTAIEEIKQDFKMQEEKNKQIEEMAKDYYGYSIDLEEDCKFVAEEMYDKGHRKLPKDSVVLDEDIVDHIKKEKAKEILLDLKPLLEGFVHTDTGENLYVYKCKQFGIELEE